MSTLYSKKWTDKNGTVRYYKDEEARAAITTLNADSTTSGSVDKKIADAVTGLNLGTAATAATTTSITSGGTGLPTSGAVYTALDEKVDKVSGKGLSTNDYTTAEQTKLSGIETGAQVNTVTSVAGRTGAVTLTSSDMSDLGTAATANTTTSITSGGTGLPTAGTVYSYTAPVIITANDGTDGNASNAPSNHDCLWVYPA